LSSQLFQCQQFTSNASPLLQRWSSVRPSNRPKQEKRVCARARVCVRARMYPKVSGLAAWSEKCKWYSSLPVGAVLSLFCESVQWV
jgi:hypothetical protein